MKIVLYKDDHTVVEVITGVSNPSVIGNSISWNNGAEQLNELQVNFVIVEDHVEVEQGEQLPASLLDEDISNNHVTETPEETIKQLRKELDETKNKLSSSETQNIQMMESVAGIYEMMVENGNKSL